MKKIMLLGTHVQAIQEIGRELSKEYVVLQSSRGLRALDLLRLFEPEALVLLKTSNQPDFSELVNRARTEPAGKNIPILLMAPKGARFTDLDVNNLQTIPVLSVPVLRVLLKGLLNGETTLAR